MAIARPPDALTAPREVPLQRPPDMPPLSEAERAEAALASYLTDRWHALEAHPFWTGFRKKAREDHDFRTGTGQWDATQKAKLTRKGKAALTINEIRPVVKIILGYEAAAPLATKPIPVGKEDLEDVLVFEGVYKHASKKAWTQYECSAIFEDGVVGGLAFGYAGVDYAEDWMAGKPIIKRLPWDAVSYDPGSTDYDLSDVREIFYQQRVALDELKARYPTKAAEIDLALQMVPTGEKLANRGYDLPPRNPQDGYAPPFGNTLQLWDAATKEVVVVEAWYRIWREEWVLVDKRLEQLTPVPEAALGAARLVARVDPLVTLVRKPRREYEMCVFLPATKTFLAGGQPHENDKEHHPIVQFVADREGDEILGVVRNLKDMQRDVNKRRSALADLAGRQRYKWFVHAASLDNPEALEDDSSDVFYLRTPSLGGIKEVGPVPLPQWFVAVDEKGKAEIREASLVNAPLQGQGSASQSGIALAQLKQQGQIGTATLFSRFRWTRHLLAQRYGARVQQCYTTEKTLRLDMGAQGTQWVTLNERVVKADGTIQVVRNIPSLKWDMEMVDAPDTPTVRLSRLLAMLEIVSKVPPEYGEALIDKIFGLADLQDLDEILRRVQAIQIKKGVIEAPPGMAPPAGGNGAAGPGAGPPGAPPPGVTPGLATRMLQGAPALQLAPENAPLADNLRMAGGALAGAV